MILICYDGSADARTAIQHAAELFDSQPVTVLTVWQPFVQLAARAYIGFGGMPAFPDEAEIDEASRKRAEELAREGAGLAGEQGLNAQPATCAQQTTTARAILARAEELKADAIVMGSRGLTGVKSLLLGSVSHEVIQHADRAVVVVPSAEVAASRARQISEQAAAHG
jgi:nucleotide-binding universal stress UspA family protein